MSMHIDPLDAAYAEMDREMAAEQAGRRAAEQVAREQRAASAKARQRAELEHKRGLLNTELSMVRRRLRALDEAGPAAR